MFEDKRVATERGPSSHPGPSRTPETIKYVEHENVAFTCLRVVTVSVGELRDRTWGLVDTKEDRDVYS